jgi:hypothetical protein
MEKYQMAIEKVVTKIHLTEPKKDAEFWRKLPYAERLDALEQIRREYHRWKYHAEPRFQRVYTITKRQ